jgi:hypothetical protein
VTAQERRTPVTAAARYEPGTDYMSATEVAFWALHRARPHSAVSNIAFVLRSRVFGDPERLRAALAGVGVVHPILRSRFPDVDGRPRRELMAGEEWLDFSTLAAAPDPERLRDLARRPFDLSEGRLLRCVAFPGGMLVIVHHVVFDIASVVPFVETLCSLLAGDVEVPGTIPAGFDEARRRDLDYWTERLRGASARAMALRPDRPAPADPSFEARFIRHALDEDVRRKVRALARERRATPNVVFCAAYLTMLRRHGAGDDLFVAIPVSLRSPRHTGQVGCMFTTLPLRVRITGAQDFGATVSALRQRWLEAIQHRELSFSDIVNLLPMDGQEVHSPLFRHMFAYHEGALGGPLARAAGLTVEGVDTGLAHLDLELRVFEDDRQSRLALAYGTDVFDHARAEIFLEDTLAVLERLPATG